MALNADPRVIPPLVSEPDLVFFERKKNFEIFFSEFPILDLEELSVYSQSEDKIDCVFDEKPYFENFCSVFF